MKFRLLLLLVASLIPLALLAQAASAPTAKPLPAIYQKWLTEDVHWIISPEEEHAFLSLATDAERLHFVEQFWERRDPTPGTPVNEFKQEHYRRIAYSNEHFAENTSGWRTDRGHAYILYGPPDAIDTRSNTKHKTQVWDYKISSITFIGECDCGTYRSQQPLK